MSEKNVELYLKIKYAPPCFRINIDFLYSYYEPQIRICSFITKARIHFSLDPLHKEWSCTKRGQFPHSIAALWDPHSPQLYFCRPGRK